MQRAWPTLQIGALLRIPTLRGDVYGVVQSLRIDLDASDRERRFAEVQVLGEALRGESFVRGVSDYPALGTPIFPATNEELSLIYARPKASNICIGYVYQDSSIPAFALTDELLGKHFAILGTTGCGKSCSVAESWVRFSLAPFLRLKSRIDALGADKRLSFMFPGRLVQDNHEDILSRLFRIPVGGKPISLLDVSGMPTEVVDVVISVICRMIFDYAVWSERERSAPILLVCEEAHRYVPQAEAACFEPTRRAIGRMAKEGRKYGISLCLVSQRPSELATSILSQ